MASSGVAHHSVAPAQGPLQILVGLVVGRQMRNLQTALSETGYPRMVVLAQSRVCAIFPGPGLRAKHCVQPRAVQSDSLG